MDRFLCATPKTGCGAQLERKEAFDPGAEDWTTALVETETLWHPMEADRYPAIVESEYLRVRELLESSHPFGAMLQLRDLFEILIRLPVLIHACRLFHADDRSEPDKRTLLTLLQPDRPLSLGGVHHLAGQILAESDRLDPSLRELLDEIHGRYARSDIPRWRNHEIGHGALRHETDEQFRAEVFSRLIDLRTILEVSEAFYSGHAIAHEEAGTIHALTAARTDRWETLESGALILRSDRGDEPLDPFFVFEQGQLYFYDKYLGRQRKTELLEYRENRRKRVFSRRISDAYRALGRELDQQRLRGDVDGDAYLAMEAEIVDRLDAIDDFVRPSHLEDWLRESLEPQSDEPGADSAPRRGVLLLQAERGMGKSTFVRSLDRNVNLKVRDALPSDTLVLAYYINDTHRHTPIDFVSGINNVLQLAGNPELRIQPKVDNLTLKSEQKARDFAKLLGEYRRHHDNLHGFRRLVFVFDGVDEVPPASGDTILDFVPRAEDLPDGVFVLLTCRNDDEISAFTRNFLGSLETTAHRRLTRQDQEYRGVLTQYVVSRASRRGNLDPEVLLEQGEYRFLHVKLLKELILQVDIDLGDLPRGPDLVRYFLAHLEGIYGEKFFRTTCRILGLLAIAKSDLTVREIAWLIGEPALTFRLLGHLKDLRGFLEVARDYRGNRLSIAHPQYAQVFREHLASHTNELVKEWFEELRDTPSEDIDLSCDGLTYQLAFLREHLSESGLGEFQIDPSFLLKVFAQKGSSRLRDYQYERLIRVAEWAQSLAEPRCAISGWTDDELLAVVEAMRQQAHGHRLVGRRADATALLDRALSMLEGNEGKPPGAVQLLHAAVLREKGWLHWFGGQNRSAAEAFWKALDVLRPFSVDLQLGSAEGRRAARLVRHAKSGLGLARRELKFAPQRPAGSDELQPYERFDDEALDHRRLIEETLALDEQLQDGSVRAAHYLAITHLNLGWALQYDKDYAAALEHFEIAQRSLEPHSEERFEDAVNFADASNGAGRALHKSDRFDEALVHFQRAIDMRVRLSQMGFANPTLTKRLALVRRNKALALFELGRFAEALEANDEAVAIRERLLREGYTELRSYIGNGLKMRAKCLVELGKLAEARQSVDQALDVYRDCISADRFEQDDRVKDAREIQKVLDEKSTG